MSHLRTIIPSLLAGALIATAVPALAINHDEGGGKSVAIAFNSHVKHPGGNLLATHCGPVERKHDTFHCTLEVLQGPVGSPAVFLAEGLVVVRPNGVATFPWTRTRCATGSGTSGV